MSLDEVDWAILRELQKNGRLPVLALSRQVKLSPSATTERVRRLEAAGVITGYHAKVALDKVGLPVLAVVRLRYPGRRHEPLHRLLEQNPQILECLRITGEDCYTLKVAAPSIGELETVIGELSELGPVTTNIVYSSTLDYRGPVGPVPAQSGA